MLDVGIAACRLAHIKPRKALPSRPQHTTRLRLIFRGPSQRGEKKTPSELATATMKALSTVTVRY